MPPAQPPGVPSVTVSANIARLRVARGWSTRAFVAHLAATTDTPLSYTAFSAVEKGNTRVTVDLLVAVARALDVSPAILLIPHTPDPTAPFAGTSAEQFWAWLRAERPLTAPATTDGHVAWADLSRPQWAGPDTAPDVPRRSLTRRAGTSPPLVSPARKSRRRSGKPSADGASARHRKVAGHPPAPAAPSPEHPGPPPVSAPAPRMGHGTVVAFRRGA